MIRKPRRNLQTHTSFGQSKARSNKRFANAISSTNVRNPETPTALFIFSLLYRPETLMIKFLLICLVLNVNVSILFRFGSRNRPRPSWFHHQPHCKYQYYFLFRNNF